MTNRSLAARLDAWEKRFMEVEPTVLSFVEETGRFERVRDEAERAPAGPLAGLLVGIKDIFHVDGLPTRAGSELPPADLAGAQGPAVSALRAAGAIVAGKTVTTEFAYFEPGPTRNPANAAHTPGGSSSGSAAAVAAGLCDLALGTQTIGSISRPASYCGVVGFKPSHERISRAGVIPLAPSFDHVGVFSGTVELARRAAGVLIGDWRDRVPTMAPPRLGVPRGPYLESAGAAARNRFGRWIDRLRDAGFEVVEVDVMADFPDIVARHRRLVARECAEVHARWFGRYEALYRARTAQLIRTGQQVSDDEAARDRAGREALRGALEAAMLEHRVDLWISPAAPGAAPRGLTSTGDPVMNLPWSHAGLPTLVMPAGLCATEVALTAPLAAGRSTTVERLPLGLQLAGRFDEDEALLAWGESIEALFHDDSAGEPT